VLVFVVVEEDDTDVPVRLADTAGYQYHLYHLNKDAPGTDNGEASREWSYGPGIGPGATVAATRLVGFVGDSGNAEPLMSHLHIEIHRPDGRPIKPYWSLLRARRGLHCAEADVTSDWLDVSPSGFRPSDVSACVSESA
jgi:hypothetical protein